MADVNRHRFLTAVAAREFILSGAAVFTLVSEKSGERYTFKVQDGDPPMWFVKLMVPNQTFVYLGMIKGEIFKLTGKSTNTFKSSPYRAFQYMWQRLIRDEIAPNLEIWHEGKCGRCGKRLTDPNSIERGFGPECQEILDRTHLQMP